MISSLSEGGRRKKEKRKRGRRRDAEGGRKVCKERKLEHVFNSNNVGKEIAVLTELLIFFFISCGGEAVGETKKRGSRRELRLKRRGVGNVFTI